MLKELEHHFYEDRLSELGLLSPLSLYKGSFYCKDNIICDTQLRLMRMAAVLNVS